MENFKFLCVFSLILVGIESAATGGGYQPSSIVQLYKINQQQDDSARIETGYFIDGSLVVIGMYEFDGDDGFTHSTRFIADKRGYRAKVSQRLIGTADESEFSPADWGIYGSLLEIENGGSGESTYGGSLLPTTTAVPIDTTTTASASVDLTTQNPELPASIDSSTSTDNTQTIDSNGIDLTPISPPTEEIVQPIVENFFTDIPSNYYLPPGGKRNNPINRRRPIAKNKIAKKTCSGRNCRKN